MKYLIAFILNNLSCLQGATIHTSEGLYTDVILREKVNLQTSQNGNGVTKNGSSYSLEDAIANNDGGTDGKDIDLAQNWASASNGASNGNGSGNGNGERENSQKESELSARR